MGVPIMRLIESEAGESITRKKITDYSGKTVAVDTLLLMHKFMIAILNTGHHLRNKNGDITSHIHGILYKIKNFLTYGILPVFVIDGKAPQIKRKTIIARKKVREQARKKLSKLTAEKKVDERERIKQKKKMVRVTEKHIGDIKILCGLLGIPFIQAPEEADSQCAALNMTDKIYGVVSEDMDTLIFGAPVMLRDFSSKKTIIEINLEMLLKGLDVTYEQLIEIAIILGCDYCPPIKGLGGIKAYTVYKKYGSIKKLIVEVGKENEERVKQGKKPLYMISNEFLEKWEKAKKYYITANVYDTRETEFQNNLSWSEPKYDELYDFLVIKNSFEETRVNNILDDIEDIYTNYKRTKKLNYSRRRRVRSRKGGYNYKSYLSHSSPLLSSSNSSDYKFINRDWNNCKTKKDNMSGISDNKKKSEYVK